jgi:hypothetical protein
MGGTYWGCMRKKIWGEYLDQEEEVVGGWRKLHNEALHNLCASPNIIRVIKPRKGRLEGHAARMGIANAHDMLVGKLEGKEPRGRPGYRWKIILERILGKQGGRCGLDSSVSGQRPMAGPFERGNVPSGSIKCRGFPE